MRTGALLGVAAVAAGLMMTPAPGRPQAQAAEPARPEAAPSVKIPAVLPPDVAFGRFIALIRGHLLTGDELVRQRDWRDAHRHFMFPLEEIYGVIREDLPVYKTPPFDGALRALARTVATHNVKQYPKALEKVEDALAAAEAGLKLRQPDWPPFVVEIAVAVLKTASDEYDDAVANDRVVHPVGYRTARGFILQADRMIESVAGDLEVKNPDALRDIRKGFTRLKRAFAAVNAPKRAPIDQGAMLSIIARIGLAAAKLQQPNRPNNP
ncbi:MAG: hypothetical protein ACRECA_07970 [Pseudolabrys sp.]